MDLEKNKLQHPVFILSLLLLIGNDLIFKEAFGNDITGKLSDFAGLFAFPFFFSCLFPTRKKLIYVATLFLFVWWKSSLSQPFIDGVNLWGIPVNRVVDYSDNVALISVFASYVLFSGYVQYKKIKPLFLYSVILLCSFAFVATSLAPRTMVVYTSVDKTYQFKIPIEELVARFNDIQKKEIERMACENCAYGEFDENTGVFYSSSIGDTLAYIINLETHKPDDTIKIQNYLADFQIFSNSENYTTLKLINIATSVQRYKYKLYTDSLNLKQNDGKYGYPVRDYVLLSTLSTMDEEKLKQKAVKEFEKRVIGKLR